MQERKTFVAVWGITFDCTYLYEREQKMTLTDPPFEEGAILVVCKVGGVDIFEMLTKDQTDIIEEAILGQR
mgnify:CR=1 FL=1